VPASGPDIASQMNYQATIPETGGDSEVLKDKL